MGTGNTSSILMMDKKEQQAAMQGALTLQKTVDKTMGLIDSKIEQNMALPSNGVDPLNSIEDKSWVNGGDPEKIIGKHKDRFEQLQQKANGTSKGNE
jgi:hypothetical protein